MEPGYQYYSCDDTGRELVHDLVRERDGRLESYEGEGVWLAYSESLRDRMVPIDDATADELFAKLESFSRMAFVPDETDLDVDRKDRLGWPNLPGSEG